MESPSIKTGYGPKNAPSAESKSKASLSFLKLIREKITFNDKAAMRHVFSQIVTSLHAESPLASAIFAGHDFIMTDDNSTTFAELMKEGEVAMVQTKNFTEKPPGKNDPKLHFHEDDYSTGAALYQADLTVRAILSLQSTPETAERLATFKTGVEQIEYLRLEIELKVLNSTTVLHKFLKLYWSKKFTNFRSWASFVMTEFQKIDWENIDRQDILNFVLLNAGPNYDACMKEIYQNHQGATFEEICQRVSLYEEAQKVINNLKPQRSPNTGRNSNQQNWRRSPQNALAASYSDAVRSDGSSQRCTICKEYGHRYDQCPNVSDPQHHESRRNNYRNRSNQQNRNKTKNRQRDNYRSESAENAKQIQALQKALQQVMRNPNTSLQANIVTEGHWSGIPKSQNVLMISTPTKVSKQISQANQNRENHLKLYKLKTIEPYSLKSIETTTKENPKFDITFKGEIAGKRLYELTEAEKNRLLYELLQDRDDDIPTTYATLKRQHNAYKESKKTKSKPLAEDELTTKHPDELNHEQLDRVLESQAHKDNHDGDKKIGEQDDTIDLTNTESDEKKPAQSHEPRDFNQAYVQAPIDENDTTASVPPSPFVFKSYKESTPSDANSEMQNWVEARVIANSPYDEYCEDTLTKLLIAKRSKTLKDINDKIRQLKHELAALEEQRNLYRLPITDLLSPKVNSNIENPDYARNRSNHHTPHRRQYDKKSPRGRHSGKIHQHKPSKAILEKKRTRELDKIKERMHRQQRQLNEVTTAIQRQKIRTPTARKGNPNHHVFMINGTPRRKRNRHPQSTQSTFDKNSWVLDSGATLSYVNSLKYLSNVELLATPAEIGCALSGKKEIINYFGTLPNGMQALYAPNFISNLISAQDATKCFGKLTLAANEITANVQGKEIQLAEFTDGQYMISPEKFMSIPATRPFTTPLHANLATIDDAKLRFRQTGAPGLGKLCSLQNHINGFPKIAPEDGRQLFRHHDVIKTIATTRQIATSFKHTNRNEDHPEQRAYKFLEKISCDTAHEPNHPSINGDNYWESVKCHGTNYGWVLPLQDVKDLRRELPKFLDNIQNHCGMPIRIMKTDNHQCYKNSSIQNYFSKNGITHETSTPNASPQNGFVEISIRFIREKARSLLEIAKLPVELWNFAIVEAARIINLLPCSANPDSKSPYEMACGAKAHVSQLVVFGSIAWVRIDPKERSGKMCPIAKPYIFIGLDRKGYILWDPRLTRGTDASAKFATIHAQHVNFDQSCTWTQNYYNEIAQKLPITRTHVPLTTKSLQLDRYCFESLDKDTPTDFRIENKRPHPFTPPILEGRRVTIIEPETDTDKQTIPEKQANHETKLKCVREVRTQLFPKQGREPTSPNQGSESTPHIQGSELISPNQGSENLSHIQGRDTAVTKRTKKENTPRTEESHRYNTRGNPNDENSHFTRGKLKGKLRAAKMRRKKLTPSDRAFGKLYANIIHESKVSWMAPKLKYEVGVDEACRIPLPRNLQEALAHPQWRGAIDKEIASIKANETFKFEPINTSHANDNMKINNKPIRTHFVFKAKPDENGKLLKLKARLVANGNNQEAGENYFASYAPVAAAATIKMQLANALFHDMVCESWDYKSAYLQSKLDEIIYITLPGNCAEYGIIVPTGHRILLVKSIYGLVQAGNVWNKLLSKSILDTDFVQCPYDPCLFVKTCPDNSLIVITCYVDDLLVSATGQCIMDKTYDKMSGDLEIGNREGLNWHLGMHFKRDGNKYIIDQSGYAIEIINEFNMQNCKPRKTPMKLDVELSKSDAPQDEETFELAQQLPYRRIVGKTMHLGRTSRPDISEAVAECSKFLANWGPKHWAASKDIVRYLKGAHDIPLVYEAIQVDESPIHVYVDAAYANDLDDRKSQTGIAVFYYDCLVFWKSKKQKLVTQSSCEAEYVALADAANETIHLRRIADFIDPNFDMDVPTTIHEDNQGTIALAYSDGKTKARSKHIDIRIHKLREYIKEGIIHLEWVDTNNQRADFFTKPLSTQKHNHMRNLNMNCDQLSPPPDYTEGRTKVAANGPTSRVSKLAPYAAPDVAPALRSK
jgi:hypothetical protein